MPIYEFVCMQCESTTRSSWRWAGTPTARTAARRTCASSSPSSRRTGSRPRRELRRRRRLLRRLLRPAADPSGRRGRFGDARADGSRGCRSRLHQVPALAGTNPGRVRLGASQAELMFVGEAPGFHEDKQGIPFVGAGRKAARELLAGIDLRREDVYIRERPQVPPAGEPRPAAGRDRGVREPPLEADRADPAEARRDADSNFATKLLTAQPTGITQVHGRSGRSTWAADRVLLYPLYHPAAALYTPRMLDVLAADFARIPALLGRPTGRAAARAGADPRARHRGAGRPARPLLTTLRTMELESASRPRKRRPPRRAWRPTCVPATS